MFIAQYCFLCMEVSIMHKKGKKKHKHKNKDPINLLSNYMLQNVHLKKNYSWLLLIGHIPYGAFAIGGIISHWEERQFQILFKCYLPLFLLLLSWFIRQRAQEILTWWLLNKSRIRKLELKNNPLFGDLVMENDPPISQNTNDKSKQASSTCQDQEQK